MHKIIPLRDHGHNRCRCSRRISHPLERLGLYRCRHGITAALPDLAPDGAGLAIAGVFETETEARAALSKLPKGRRAENAQRSGER